MKKRLLGGALVVIVLLGALLIGDKIFRLVMTIVSLLGLKELMIMKKEEVLLFVMKWVILLEIYIKLVIILLQVWIRSVY